jgi:ligand-binding SRPBCC domain-containing protein
MRIYLRTKVQQDPQTVWQGFDQNLFLKLKPPGIKLKLLRFDGCETGHQVEMELGYLFKQRWKGRITEHGISPALCYFVDESQGSELPFFLRRWRHRHLLQAHKQGTEIIDDIEYQAPLGLNLLLYPLLWLQFAWRKPIYRRIFGKA